VRSWKQKPFKRCRTLFYDPLLHSGQNQSWTLLKSSVQKVYTCLKPYKFDHVQQKTIAHHGSDQSKLPHLSFACLLQMILNVFDILWERLSVRLRECK